MQRDGLANPAVGRRADRTRDAAAPDTGRIKDPRRVDVTDARELAAWALLLQVDEAAVLAAVEAVGPSAALVAVHLARRSASS